jgi:hypothetical protein
MSFLKRLLSRFALTTAAASLRRGEACLEKGA